MNSLDYGLIHIAYTKQFQKNAYQIISNTHIQHHKPNKEDIILLHHLFDIHFNVFVYHPPSDASRSRATSAYTHYTRQRQHWFLVEVDWETSGTNRRTKTIRIRKIIWSADNFLRPQPCVSSPLSVVVL